MKFDPFSEDADDLTEEESAYAGDYRFEREEVMEEEKGEEDVEEQEGKGEQEKKKKKEKKEEKIDLTNGKSLETAPKKTLFREFYPYLIIYFRIQDV